MNKISRWAIYNPVPTIVLFLVLTLAGLYSYGKLRVNNMPDVDIPTVTISVSQTGASPTELQADVTKTVENAVSALANVDTVTSSVSEGSSTTSVAFYLGTDIDRATSDVQTAINGIISSLPDAASTPVVKRVEDTGQAIISYAVEAPGKSLQDISWYVDDALARRILTATGVASIKRSGGVDRAIIVSLDPDRLSALGLSASTVSQSLATVNVNKPGGRLNTGTQEQTIRTLASVSSLEDLQNMRIPVSKGQNVRLGDLGSVEDKWSEPRQKARLNGNEVVVFGVYRSVGSSEVAAATSVRGIVDKINGENNGYKLTEISSSTPFVVESYDAAIEALLLGAVLAIVVVYLFLRDIRATIISAIAMPLSLVPSFAIMWYLNLSLNNISLLALSLVVGILVDDAIVEIENIVRHMRMHGKGPFVAAREAADEIGLAVVATTGTLVAVFAPVGLMPGIPGQIFMSFAIVISVSVLFSLLVARMLTPLMGAYLLKSEGHKDDEARWIPAYLALLRAALRFRWLTLLAGLIFFAGSLWLATKLPVEFSPASDRSMSQVSIELPPGATLSETDAVVQAATDMILKEDGVLNVLATIGTPRTGGFGGNVSTSGSVNSASLTVMLKPKAERSRSQADIEKDMMVPLSTIAGARINVAAGGLSSTNISVTLVGNDQEVLEQTADRLRDQMAGIGKLSNVVNTSAASKPELIIRPDLERSAEIGVSPASISTTINIATLGDQSSALPKFSFGDRQLSIIVTLDADAIRDPDRLAMLPIAGTSGTVPLGAIAEISYGAGPSTISRVDRTQKVSVRADLNGLTIGQANTLVSALPILKDLPASVSRLDQGDLARLTELFNGFAVAMISGILLMYFTLVLLFKSFMQPITILTALPLSIGGALGFLYVSHMALGITVLIGILMLMGIAAKNSILLVEYALVEQERGIDRLTALLDAAAKRARPIVMTSIAMGAGMLPIALGYGADSETRAPMGTAVVGGLVSSTLLSLIYVPVVYTFIDDLQSFFGRWLGKLVTRPSAEDFADAAVDDSAKG